MFIRTKDNVYIKIRDTEFENKHIVVGKTPIDFGTYILKKDIIKQADTIAELCDEFVIKNQHNTYYTMNYEDMISDYHWGRFHERDTIYGAIWTDKGLIYVAKMNENGELELI